MPRPAPAALLAGLVALVASASPAPAAGPAAPAAATLDAPLTYTLSPFALDAPEIALAWEALRAGDPAIQRHALDALDRRLAAPGAPPWDDPHTAATAAWLRADLARALGLAARAEADLEALAAGSGTLADPARLALAALREADGRKAPAAAALLAVTAGTAEHLPACRRAARLLREAGEAQRGAAALEAVLARPLSERARNELTFLAADLWREAGDAEAAGRLLRDLWWKTADGAVVARAEEALAAAGAPLDAVETLARRVLQAPRSRVEELRDELRQARPATREAKRARRWALAVLDRHDPEAREAAADTLARMAPRVEGTPLAPWFAFGRAMVLRKLDRDLEAAALYERVADRWPAHVLTVDALVEAAGLLAWRGLPAEADALYRRAVGVRRPGPAQREALWQAGFAAHLAGDLGDARVFLERLVERYGGDRDGLGITWAERGGYWLARTAQRQGQLDRAVRGYSDVAGRFPLGWYGTLAARRRDEILARPDAPSVAFAMVERGPRMASRDGAVPDSPRPLDALNVVRRPVLDRAVALLRLGEEDAARAELDALLEARRLPGSGRALLATMLRRAGEPERAGRVLQQAGVLAEVPTPDDAETYAAAYRFDHGDVIEAAAAEQGVPPALLAGLVHIESRYNPSAVSPAGAVGLTQLLPETAQVIARRMLGEAGVTRRGLLQPETNLRIGAAYLGGLLRYFKGHPVLALAGYNAGRGAARAWLRRRGHLETDAFVETIPYDQTRRYVMRVIAVAEVYRRLHGLPGATVDVPMKLPMGLGPFLDE